MFKNLLLAAAVATALTANAEVIWEGAHELTWSNALIINASAFGNLEEGDLIQANFDVTGSYGNLEFKANIDGWPGLTNNADRTNVTPATSGDYYTPSVKDSAVKVAAEDVENLKASGMVIQGDLITISSIEIISAAEAPAENVWTGEANLAVWEDFLTIPANYCRNLKEGDKITIYFTVGDADTYGQIAIKDTSWQNIDAINATMTNLDQWGNFQPTTTSTTATIGTAELAAQLAANGFILQGKNMTVTKVVCGDEETEDPGTGETPSDSNVVWEGEQAIGWGSDALIIPGSKFANVKAGDLIHVDFEVTGDYSNLWLATNTDGWPRLTNSAEATNLNTEYDSYNPGTTETAIKIAEADIANLQAGLVLQGANTTVFKVEIISEGSSAVGNVAVSNNAPVEYFNLQGVRISEPAAGTIVIRRQGNEVKKVIF